MNKKLVPLLVIVIVLAATGIILSRQGVFGPDEERSRTPGVPIVDPAEEAWTTLREIANGLDERNRAESLEVLVGFENAEREGFLKKGLEDDSSAWVRIRAAGLRALRGRKDLVPLIHALAMDEDDSDVWLEAARAYGRLGTPESIARLVTIVENDEDADLDYGDDGLAEAAIWLARLGHRDAIPAIRALRKKEGEDAYPLSVALLAFGETDVTESLLAACEDDADEIAPLLGIPDCDAFLPVCAAILGDTDGFQDERGLAAIALARIGTPPARKMLADAWDRIPEEQRAAEARLPAGTPPSAATSLLELRRYLAAAFALLGDGRGLDLLDGAVADIDLELAIPALQGVAHLGRGASVETLMARLKPTEERRTRDDDLARAWTARAILTRDE